MLDILECIMVRWKPWTSPSDWNVLSNCLLRKAYSYLCTARNVHTYL